MHRPSLSRRINRGLAAAGATASALAVWAVAELALGVDLRSPATSAQPSHDIAATHVAVAAATSSLAGWALLAVLERLTARARTVWTVIAAAVLVVSLGAPLSGAEITAADQAVLVALHITVAAVLVPALRRSSAQPTRPASNHEHAADAARIGPAPGRTRPEADRVTR